MKEAKTGNYRKWWIILGILYALLLLGIITVANRAQINHWIKGVLVLFRPILWGLVLAYLLNPFFRLYERKLLYRLRPMGLRRALSLTLTYLTLLLIFLILTMLIFPQLYMSIARFLANYQDYIVTAVNQFNAMLERINGFLGKAGIVQDIVKPLEVEKMKISLSYIFLNFDKILDWLKTFFADGGSQSLIATLSGFVSGALDLLFAFFVSLYLLSTKEKRYAQIMKVRCALFSDSFNNKLTKACGIADRSMGGFIEGKLLDSLIIGILAYIALVIFRIPYAVLLATIVGITNVIPFVGPIIGAIPTSVIILLTEPGKVIPFLIIVLVIQQLDGNIIGPKILGSNTGVSSLCVLIAITVMGSIWGFVGMVLGVPLFAIVVELVSDQIKTKLRAKGYPSPTENYYPADSFVDPARDARGGSDSNVKNLERHIMRIRKLEEREETLSRADRCRKSFYNICRKYRLIPEMSEELLTQYAAEEAARNAEEETLRLIREARGTDLLERD